jgi:hypothetical protein
MTCAYCNTACGTDSLVTEGVNEISYDLRFEVLTAVNNEKTYLLWCDTLQSDRVVGMCYVTLMWYNGDI